MGTVRSIYAVHAYSASVPSCPGWCEQFCLIATYNDIGRDGGWTHHAGVFQNGPISLQLPVLHMQSSQSLSESVSQQRKP